MIPFNIHCNINNKNADPSILDFGRINELNFNKNFAFPSPFNNRKLLSVLLCY